MSPPRNGGPTWPAPSTRSGPARTPSGPRRWWRTAATRRSPVSCTPASTSRRRRCPMRSPGWRRRSTLPGSRRTPPGSACARPGRFRCSCSRCSHRRRRACCSPDTPSPAPASASSRPCAALARASSMAAVRRSAGSSRTESPSSSSRCPSLHSRPDRQPGSPTSASRSRRSWAPRRISSGPGAGAAAGAPVTPHHPPRIGASRPTPVPGRRGHRRRHARQPGPSYR